MGRPYALLRVGFSYDKTLGMRRLTNTPVDLAVDSSGDLFILCRGGISFIRRLSQDDEDLGAINLAAGGAAQIGGTHSVNAKFVWPASMVMDGEENLWISDEGTNQITIIDKQGEILGQWGEPGSGEGQFDRQSASHSIPTGTCTSLTRAIIDTEVHEGWRVPDGIRWLRLSRGRAEYALGHLRGRTRRCLCRGLA